MSKRKPISEKVVAKGFFSIIGVNLVLAVVVLYLFGALDDGGTGGFAMIFAFLLLIFIQVIMVLATIPGVLLGRDQGHSLGMMLGASLSLLLIISSCAGAFSMVGEGW